MKYLKRVLTKAIAPTFRVLDTLGFVIPPLVGSLYWVLGQPMPSKLGEVLGVWILGGAIVILFLRFVSAPYLIWKEDQKKIKELEKELEEAKNHEGWAQAKINEQVQASLTEERIRLGKALQEFESKIFEIRGLRNHTDLKEYLNNLKLLASPFKTQRKFSFLFEHMISAIENSWLINRADEINVEDHNERTNLANWHSQHAVSSAAAARDTLLGGDENFPGYEAVDSSARALGRLVIEIKTQFPNDPEKGRLIVTLSDPTDEYLWHQSPQDIGTKTPH